MSACISSSPIRAAQYLRMSSDNQRYSTENQRNAIAEYASVHNYDVVASYVDAGKSGLSLKGRSALKQLLSDALSRDRGFDVILVLDVSRWGRFQNPDQAAHYEFLCREAGVQVIYCGEPFGDDIAPATTIMKHLKRVMAGEYSRDLSAKLSRAHLQQASLGFRQGGTLIYGFRRLLVDQDRKPRQVLNTGEHKALATDRVVIIPGPPEELAVIRRIFRLYVRDHLSIKGIATRLAKSGVQGYGDKPLGYMTIRHLLSHQLCLGKLTYNRTTKKLQGPTLRNPEELWTHFTAFDPIVPISVFTRAQQRLARGLHPRWDRETIGNGLRRVLEQNGRLSGPLINQSKDTPSADTVVSHFGSLTDAYASIGYDPGAPPFFGMNGKHWSTKTLLSGLQQLWNAKGRISNRLITLCPGLPSDAYIRRRFGTLAEAMRQAGLPASSHSEIQRDGWRRRRAAGCDERYLGVRWTDARLIHALSRLHQKHGYISVELLNHNRDTPSAYYFIKRFGSLSNARLMARLPVPTRSEYTAAGWQRKKEGKMIKRHPRFSGQHPGLHYRSEDILRALRRLAEREGMISAVLVNDDRSSPSVEAVVRHFGSLISAYKLAGLVRLDGKRFGPPTQPRV